MPDEFDSFIGKVTSYEDALKQEYTVASNADDVQKIRELIEKKIALALPHFVDDLIIIARAGDTDSTRLRAIQFAFNWYFKEGSTHSDPFTALLSELTKTPQPDQNNHIRPQDSIDTNDDV